MSAGGIRLCLTFLNIFIYIFKMIDNDEARFKAITLTKFKNEQYEKMGGSHAPLLGFALGIAAYLGSSRYPLHVERVPYKLMLATLGYAAGVNLSAYFYGDKKNYVYYSQRE